MLERDRGRFEAARRACLELPLGAGAAVGLDFDLDREAVAADLGFERVVENSLDAVADRDFVADYLAAAAQLGAHLSRLGGEITLWASGEFGFVQLPDAYSGGSSIMPQKRNPDAAELMRAATPRLTADLGGLLGVLHGLPLAYNTDLREDKRYLFDAVDCLDALLPVVLGLLQELTWTGPADVSLDELRELAPDFDEAYYGLHEPVAQLARKRSRGGSAPARVRERLGLAQAALKAHACC